MKKLLSILLSTEILLMLFSPCFGVLAVEVDYALTMAEIEKFSDDVSELTEKYNDVDMEDKIKTRLIVSTEEKIEEYNATESVYGIGYAILQYEAEKDATVAFRALNDDGYEVSYDAVFNFDNVISSPETSETWANERIESKEVLEAIKASGKELSEVTVGVIDTGVDYTHTIFDNRIVQTDLNFSGNGYENDCMDEKGHGTGVASIIVQNTTENVKIKPYKVDTREFAFLSTLLSAFTYIVEEKNPPDIINMSFGSNSVYLELEKLLQKVYARGIVLIASAGNDNQDSSIKFPAWMKETITVAASNDKNEKSNYSNFGSIVDIAAPGDKAHIAVPGGGYQNDKNGTSFSAPLVSAAAATVLMQNDKLSPTQVKERIQLAAFPILDPYSDFPWCGSGILNYWGLNEETIAPPMINVGSGFYSESVILEITTPKDGIVKYTTDGTYPSETNGFTYKEPINITESTNLVAVAIGENGHSRFIGASYIINHLADEKDFKIDDSGYITEYTGDTKELIVPSTINGKIVRGVDGYAFTDSEIRSVVFPDTLTIFEEDAFAFCDNLAYIEAPGLIVVKEYSMTSLINLQYFIAPNLQELYSPISSNKITDLNLPKLQYVDEGVLGGNINLKRIWLPSLKEIPNDLFRNDSKIEEIWIENAEIIGDRVFINCNNIKLIYAPNLKTAKSLPNNENAIVVLSSKFVECPLNAKGYDLTIYGTPNTFAQTYANTYNLDFVALPILQSELPSEYIDSTKPLTVDALGFNLEYQWYGNTVADDTTGTPIEDAIGKEFNPSDYTAYPYYYCVITSTDGDYNGEIKTGLTVNVNLVGTHNFGEWETVIPATCTEKGLEKRSCANCDYEETRDVLAFEHDLIHHDAQAPTCTEIGWNEYDTCSRCDYSTYNEIPKLGHDYKSTVTPPTCTEKGFTTYTCSRCNDNYVSDYTDDLGHTNSEKVIENKINPTCITNGSHDEVIYCTVCNAELSRKNVIDEKLGHYFGEWAVTKEATETEKGLKERICTICSAIETATIPIIPKEPTTESTAVSTEPPTKDPLPPANPNIPNTSGRIISVSVVAILTATVIVSGAISTRKKKKLNDKIQF